MMKPGNILSIIFLCIGYNIFAQEYINTINILGDKLPNREVLSSCKDSKENVWVLTSAALCRITGKNVDCYDLHTKDANDLFLVSTSYLVIHNKFTASCVYFDLNSHQTSMFKIPNGARLFRNFSHDSELYFYDNGNISKYNFVTKTTIFVKKLKLNFIRDRVQLFRSNIGELLSVGEHGIDLNGNIVKAVPNESFLFQQIYEGKESFIYNEGKRIMKIDKSSLVVSKLYEDDLICKSLWQDEKGNFIVGLHKKDICRTIESLLFFDQNWKEIKDHRMVQDIDKNGFAANIQSSDFLKELNVATWNGYKQYKALEPFSEKILYSPLPKGKTFGIIARGLTKDKEGSVYMMTEEEKIYRLAKNGLVDTIDINVFIKDKVKPMSFGRNLEYDENSHSLYGICGEYTTHHSTLFRYDITNKTTETIKSIDHRFFSMIKYSNKLIIASAKNHVFTFDISTSKFDTLYNFNEESIHVRVLNAIGNSLYVGCKEGLYLYDFMTGKIRKINALEGIQVNSIIVINKNLYLGTVSGIFILDANEKITNHFSIKNGLPNDDVKSILFFNANEAMIPTSKGLCKINFKEKIIYQFNTQSHHLCHEEYNGLAHGIIGNKMFLGTINGYDIFNLDKLNLKNSSIPILDKITTINDDLKESINYNFEDKKIIFKPNELKKVIDFSTISNSFNVAYAYKFGKSDSLWHLIDGSTLELLRPSKDIDLLIKCTDENGNWSETYCEITISSKNYFYKSPIFYLLLTSLFTALIFYYSKKREAENNRKKEELYELNNKISKLKLESLLAQMNPHFIFNAITSIQYFINKKDVKEADEYLVKFSTLMRKTLENSTKKSISLSEEIAMLKYYIHIEQTRFKNGFNVEFIIDDAIDEDFVQLPPMLLQPLVENAINHGLLHSQERIGNLILKFDLEKETLLVKIIDNGKGLTIKNSDTSHKSYALKIISDRIEAYKKTGDFDIGYKLYNNADGVGATSELRVLGLNK